MSESTTPTGDQATGILSPWLRKRRIAAALPLLHGRVLDWGCGVGVLAELIPPERYVGYDRDARAIATASVRRPGHRFVSRPVDVDEMFDSVALLAVIEHVVEPVALLQDLARRLQPTGTIVLTTPTQTAERVHAIGARLRLFSPEAADEHETLFGRSDLEGLAIEAGLEPVTYRRFLAGFNQVFAARRR
jgi:SAM-dependent methyltransferase